MEDIKRKQFDISTEKKKLRKRKIISTGLLVFMTISYIIFKKLKLDESGSLFYSSLVAFTEASMVGALADWFAVVALFRHPLGMKWIPHTAIIKNSKKKVSETLSNFVVSNFFTNEKIMGILKDIKLSEKLKLYLTENKEKISKFLVKRIPNAVTEICKNKHFRDLIITMLNSSLNKAQISQAAGIVLEKILLSNNNNIKIVKYALAFTNKEIENNREAIIEYIKQQKLLGVIGVPTMLASGVHASITNFLHGEIRKLDKNVISGVSKSLLDKLNEIPVNLKTSDELIEKVQQLKEELMESDEYVNFINNTLWSIIDDSIVNTLVVNFDNSPEKYIDAINAYIEKNIIVDIFTSKETCYKIDNWALRNLESVVSSNRMKIGKLISSSVNEWNEDEMVEKIELMIGSDLQYIRINGTIIGGLVGVLIHLISKILV